MNRRNIIAVLIFAIMLGSVSCAKAGAVELWNGFNTDMNRAQVIARARTVIGTDNFEEASGGIFHLGRDYETLYDDLSLDYRVALTSDTYRSAMFFFFNGRLFSIQIFFKATGEDLIRLAHNYYGEPTQIYTDRGNTVHEWALSEKIVLASLSFSSLTIFDRQAYENMVREREQQRLEEEEKRRTAADRIQF